MTEAGIIFVVILISSAGILAGRKVSSSSDFLTGGGKASTLLTTGTFLGIIGSQSTISVIAQVTACIGFIAALYPSITTFTASAFTVILMCLYIVMGGTWGAGMAGG